MLRSIILAAGAAAFACGSVADAAIVIDDFNTATPGLYPISVPTNFAAAVMNEPAPSVLGGQRTSVLVIDDETTLYPGLIRPQGAVHTVGGAGVYEVASPADFNGKLRLSYGLSALAAPFNLTADGSTGFQVRLAAYDAPGNLPMTLSIEVVDTAVPSSKVASVVVPPGASTLFVPFAAFPGVNFGSLDRADFVFDFPAGGDFRVDNIATAVPEPATAGLLLLAAATSATRRRR